MRLYLEKDSDPELVRLWWKQEINGKTYGQYLRVRLPAEDLTPLLSELKRGFEDTLADLTHELDVGDK